MTGCIDNRTHPPRPESKQHVRDRGDEEHLDSKPEGDTAKQNGARRHPVLARDLQKLMRYGWKRVAEANSDNHI